MIQIEKATATERSGAALGAPACLREQAFAHGTYHAIFEGYKEQHKGEFLSGFLRLQQLRAKRDKLLRFTPKVMIVGWLKAFLKEIDDLDAYLKSLTEIKGERSAENIVTTVGGNLALDTYLAGSGYTVTGPYMGLIGAVSYVSVPVIADTMGSHATWTECGTANAPTYTGPRKTIAWSAASAKSKSPSAAPVYTFTGTGTVKGAFLVFGSGAVSTIDSTAGVLYSAGLFSGGDQPVVNTNTLTLTYAAGI